MFPDSDDRAAVPGAPTFLRPRRLRTHPVLREMVSETRLSVDDLIYPLFVREGAEARRPIASMPGIAQWSVDGMVGEARRAAALGLRAVILFGIPAVKDAQGSQSHAPDGIVQRAVRALKRDVPELLVLTDVCLCEYTDHGHCGLVHGTPGLPTHDGLPPGHVLNDESLEVLARIALSHVAAGADVVAPSAMLDGQVAAIRAALDARGDTHVPILSYAVKYASSFYGPFREAAEGAPRFGDRRGQQMDPANAREGLREADLDVAQGADLLMVKPALAYLDVIRRVKDRYPALPLAAYNVSGEYAMLKAAARQGWLEERDTVLETLLGIKRAGADLILTYHAPDVARWLAEEPDSLERATELGAPDPQPDPRKEDMP